MSARGIDYKTSNQRRSWEPGVFHLCETQPEPSQEAQPQLYPNTPFEIFHSKFTIAQSPSGCCQRWKRQRALLLCPHCSLFLSLLVLSGIERKKKVNTQAAPALFNHFTLPALISLQHAAVIVTNQNLSVFVLEAFSPSFFFTLVWLACIYLLV